MRDGNKIIRLFTTILPVLIAYISLRSIQLVYAIIYSSESPYLLLGRAITVVAVFFLSYLTYKRNLMTAWAMAIFLALHGLSLFFFGLFAVSLEQYILKATGIIFGAYFLYGAVILFRSIRKGEMESMNSI